MQKWRLCITRKCFTFPHPQKLLFAMVGCSKTTSPALQVVPVCRTQDLEHSMPFQKTPSWTKVLISFLVGCRGSTTWLCVLKRSLSLTRVLTCSIVTAVRSPFSYVCNLQWTLPNFLGCWCFLSRAKQEGSWDHLLIQSGRCRAQCCLGFMPSAKPAATVDCSACSTKDTSSLGEGCCKWGILTKKSRRFAQAMKQAHCSTITLCATNITCRKYCMSL